MTVESLCRVKSCADKSRAVLSIMGNDEGTIGVHIRDDDGDTMLIAISPVDASRVAKEIAKHLAKVVNQ